MSCSEVGEYMQRQLDHDLNEFELKMLMEHIRDCQSCHALFERLTLLSGSLEQLPRVTPPISIVDSIMPDLLKLDAIKDAKITIKRKKRMKWITSISSFSAAAAIILIMFTITGKQDIEIAQNAAYVPMKADEMSDRLFANEDSTMQRIAEENIDQKSKILHEDKPSIDILSTEPEVEKEAPNGNVDTEYTASIPEPETVIPQPSVSSNPVQVDEFTSTSSPAVEPQVGGITKESLPEEGIPEAMNPPEDVGFMLDITSHTELNKYYSPDEIVYLLFEEHTIAVYDTSSDELIKMIDKPLAGQYSLHWWSEDHKQLQIHVIDVDGREHILDFDI